MKKKKVMNLGLLALTAILLTGCGGGEESSISSSTGGISSDSGYNSSDSTSTSSEDPSSSSSIDDEEEEDDTDASAVVETMVEADGYDTGNLDAEGGFYTDYASLADEQQAAKKVAVQIAEEGDVLLKNANSALPLRSSEKNVTLFGMASVDLVTAGGGSGSGTVDNNGIAHSTLQSSLEDAGFTVNPSTLNLYESYDALGTINNELPISNYTPSTIASYYGYSDAAIITFSRMGTENKDLATNNVEDHENEDDHTLQLDDNEVALVKHVKEHFSKVIVLINSSNIMQIPELAEENTESNLGVDAILWIGGVGNNGVDAVGSILNGDVNPSGHTCDIWTRDFTQDPSFTNFGFDTQNKDENGERMDSSYYDKNGNITNYNQVEYREGIYNGYKYYETKATDMGSSGESWYQSQVLYPYGYGLSYTEFEWKWVGTEENRVIDAANQTVTVKVKVTNTGSVAGKDVVQLYYSAPYTTGEIEKASNNLVNFAKTDILEPGESEIVEIQFVAQDMASFDYNDANNNNYEGYELEAGDYIITANRDSHTPVLELTRTIENDIKCETDYTTGKEIKPIFTGEFDSTNETLLANSISRATGLHQPAASTVADRTLDDATIAEYDDQDIYEHYEDDEGDPWYVSNVPDSWDQESDETISAAIKLADMSGIDYEEPYINENGTVVIGTDEGSQKWEEFMNQISWEQMCNIVSGDASSGPAIGAMSNIGKKDEGSYSDGPVQIRGGTLFPSNPVLSSSFNTELAEKKGRLIGNEAIFLGRTQWAGGGMNTHRSPFSGRNFEYFSQDGFHASKFSAAEVRGALSKGLITYVKHFFLNDQESFRADYGGVFTWATEQTIREQYLRPFESAIKAGSMGAMSSFNRIGKQVTANSYAVHQYLLRDEWDSKADVCTDAWAKDYVPINKMAVAGSDQVLGSSNSYETNQLDHGTWNENAKTVYVKGSAESNSDDTASDTYYFGIRRRAQRALYARANSIVNENGIVAGSTIDVYLERGVSNAVQIEVGSTNDISVELADGASLPDGLSIVNGMVISGTPSEEGTFYADVNITLDGWVTSTATLALHVASAMYYNGEAISTGSAIATYSVGETIDAKIDVPTLAYNEYYSSRYYIVNWYTKDFVNYNRNEDKTASDLITIDASTADEAHEYGYDVSNLPSGLTSSQVMKSHTGLANRGSYDVVDYLQLSGSIAEAGTYTFTVTLNIPVTMYVSGWLFASFGCAEYTYEQEITIIVE